MAGQEASPPQAEAQGRLQTFRSPTKKSGLGFRALGLKSVCLGFRAYKCIFRVWSLKGYIWDLGLKRVYLGFRAYKCIFKV